MQLPKNCTSRGNKLHIGLIPTNFWPTAAKLDHLQLVFNQLVRSGELLDADHSS